MYIHTTVEGVKTNNHNNNNNNKRRRSGVGFSFQTEPKLGIPSIPHAHTHIRHTAVNNRWHMCVNFSHPSFTHILRIFLQNTLKL